MVACSADSTGTGTGTGAGAGGLDAVAGSGGEAEGGGTSAGGRTTGGTGGSSTGGASGTGTGGLGTGGVIGTGGLGTGGVGGGHTCAGATNPSGVLCRTNQDCVAASTGGFTGSFDGCYMSVPQYGGCGNPYFEPQECVVDSDCGDAGVVCQTIACGGHVCAPACDPATCSGVNACVDGICTPKRCDEPGAAPCTAGFECDPTDPTASTVGCAAVHCSSAADCEAGYDCNSTAPGDGCVHRPCTVDTDCGCGYCVNAFCEATLGFCYQIVAMPYGCVWPDEELV
jgi:hypothetical protein